MNYQQAVRAAAALGIGLASLGVPLGAYAQQRDATTLRVPQATLNAPVTLPERPGVKTLGEAIARLDIYVDDELCGSVDLTPEVPGDAVTTLAATPGCSRSGAALRIVDADGRTLFEKPVLKPGSEIVMSNLAPEPPSSGGSNTPAPQAPQAPATGSGVGPGGSYSRTAWFGTVVATLVISASAVVAFIRRRSIAPRG